MLLELERIIASHKTTQQIVEKLKGGLKQEPTRFLLIKKLFLHYQKYLFQFLENSFEKSFLYVNYISKEDQNYIKSVKKTTKNSISFSRLKSLLSENNFSKQERVYSKRDFEIKGDTITFWPIEYENPIRAEFFGEQLEKLEIIDSIYKNKLKEINEFILGNCNLASSDNILSISGDVKEIFEDIVFIFSDESVENTETIEFDFVYPQLFYKRFDLLEKEIDRYVEQGYKIFINSKHKKNIPERIHEFFIESNEQIESGFVSRSLKTTLISDRELFGTISLGKKTKQKDSDKFLRQLEGEIQIGDYLVHEDYGIAHYRGITQENDSQFILLEYAEEDELLLPLNKAYKLTKYIAPSEKPPVITRLGKGMWGRLKTKVKKSIGIIAKELLENFAKREIAEVEKIENEESDGYKTFIEDFEFEETPDQLTATQEIERDLSKGKPMNRLIVGDVGFGKTEVFMRAAFKVIEKGQQVAILAPTTVLVAQHFSVLTDRFRNFPTEIASLSRFGTKEGNEKVIKNISDGKIDIVVGTHKLLSESIKFKNLGLLIIDEEQKFGVKQKELLKNYYTNVHTITLSATPIPRTLSMALSQIFDISLITTPPGGRKPIKTIVEKFHWNKVVEAIHFELNRSGQVYFLHNEVQTIQSIKTKLQTLMPSIRIAIGHGQMPPDELESVMEDFYHKKYDVLLCTTIIENGIDMPNVNTIIVNKAQNFGLAQLYQLRGRVGRSEKQAYAYIFYTHKEEHKKYDSQKIDIENEDEEEIKKKKPRKADERLRAIEDLQELGSGFSLASKDLEIRGAGNVLGKEQHGNILNIGLGLYMQLLNEEIERLKGIKNF